MSKTVAKITNKATVKTAIVKPTNTKIKETIQNFLTHKLRRYYYDILDKQWFGREIQSLQTDCINNDDPWEISWYHDGKKIVYIVGFSCYIVPEECFIELNMYFKSTSYGDNIFKNIYRHKFKSDNEDSDEEDSEYDFLTRNTDNLTSKFYITEQVDNFTTELADAICNNKLSCENCGSLTRYKYCEVCENINLAILFALEKQKSIHKCVCLEDNLDGHLWHCHECNQLLHKKCAEEIDKNSENSKCPTCKKNYITRFYVKWFKLSDEVKKLISECDK